MSDKPQLKVGDWAWNRRDSVLDLRPGWLIEVTGPWISHELNLGYIGKPVLFVGDYSDVGYYFGMDDLEPIHAAGA